MPNPIDPHPSDDPPARGRVREFPLAQCPACGSTWFREADFHEFEYSTEKRLSLGIMGMRVCSCGEPLKPRLGGVRSARTANEELGRFVASVEASQEWLKNHQEREAVFAAAAGQSVKKEELDALDVRLGKAEKYTGQRLARKDPSRKSPRGRHWTPPGTEADSAQSHVLTREGLAKELQRLGFTFDQARTFVMAFWETIISAIKRGAVVDTPLGVFQAIPAPPPRRRRLNGIVQIVNRRPRKIQFRGDEEILNEN